VNTDANANIVDAAPVAKQFIGQRFEKVCQWMQRIGKTDIILIGSRNEHQRDAVQD
jgi:hypothetical protein